MTDRFLRWLAGLGAALAAVPDPHGQFQSVPIAWTVPKQADGPPPGHPERLEPR